MQKDFCASESVLLSLTKCMAAFMTMFKRSHVINLFQANVPFLFPFTLPKI